MSERHPPHPQFSTPHVVGSATPPSLSVQQGLPQREAVKDFPVWCTLEKGLTIPGLSELKRLNRHLDGRIAIGSWGRDLLSVIQFSKILDRNISLILLSNNDLGFPEGATYDMTCVRGRQLGLTLCLPGFAPLLRFRYLDQPKGEWIFLAMRSVQVNKVESMFSLGNDGEVFRLNGNTGDPEHHWPSDAQFVFWKN